MCGKQKKNKYKYKYELRTLNKAYKYTGASFWRDLNITELPSVFAFLVKAYPISALPRRTLELVS